MVVWNRRCIEKSFRCRYSGRFSFLYHVLGSCIYVILEDRDELIIGCSGESSFCEYRITAGTGVYISRRSPSLQNRVWEGHSRGHETGKPMRVLSRIPNLEAFNFGKMYAWGMIRAESVAGDCLCYVLLILPREWLLDQEVDERIWSKCLRENEWSGTYFMFIWKCNLGDASAWRENWRVEKQSATMSNRSKL